MKLKNQLKLCRGKDVKIGSRVSFFYCDTNDNNIEQTLDKLSKEEYERLVAYKGRLKNKLDTFEETWKDKEVKRIKNFEKLRDARIKKIDKAIKDLKDKKKKKEKEDTLKEFKKQSEEDLKELKNKTKKEKEIDYITTVKYLNQTISRIDNWTPYIDRKVKEVYNSCINDYTVIIRVEGQEMGAYWDQDEYRTGIIEEDEEE